MMLKSFSIAKDPVSWKSPFFFTLLEKGTIPQQPMIKFYDNFLGPRLSTQDFPTPETGSPEYVFLDNPDSRKSHASNLWNL